MAAKKAVPAKKPPVDGKKTTKSNKKPVSPSVAQVRKAEMESRIKNPWNLGSDKGDRKFNKEHLSKASKLGTIVSSRFMNTKSLPLPTVATSWRTSSTDVVSKRGNKYKVVSQKQKVFLGKDKSRFTVVPYADTTQEFQRKKKK